MIHLKIISAKNLPLEKPKTNHFYIKLFLINYDVQATKSIGITKKVKNTPDPEWCEKFPIPFVGCQSVFAQILDETSRNSGSEIVGSAIIPINLETVDSKEHTSNISLSDGANDKQPILTYSIEPCTKYPFKEKYYKNPDAFYCYLSYDPPLKQNETVELNFGLVNNEGTAMQGIENYFVSYESKPTHLGPTGPTQVLYFPRLNFFDAQFFFYAKTIQYQGTITLNFVYAPVENSPRYLAKKFIQSPNNGSISVNQKSPEHEAFSVFPVMICVDSNSVNFNLFKVPPEVIEQILPICDNSNHLNKEENEAVDKIYDLVGRQLCPEGKEFKRRYNVYPGIKCTLNDLFKYQKIEIAPKVITIGIGWNPSFQLDSSIIPIEKNGKALEPICYFHPVNTKRGDSIRTSSQTVHQFVTEDNEKIRFKLGEIDPNVKYLGVAATCGKGIPISEINGVYCRMIDEESKKEVMYMKLPKRENHPGVLFGILTKVEGTWCFWPTAKFFDGKNPDQAKRFFESYVKSGVVDKFMKS